MNVNGGIRMDQDKRKKRDDEKVAPGLDAEDALEKDASEEEVEKGEYTQVTKLTLDEYDPSTDED